MVLAEVVVAVAVVGLFAVVGAIAGVGAVSAPIAFETVAVRMLVVDD